MAERSRIWQALLESEDRYRATFDYAPVGIMHTGVSDDRILHVNPKLSEMLGYTENELLGMTADDIVHPDHVGADKTSYHDRMLAGTIDSYSSERRYVRKDGVAIWVKRTVSLARDTQGVPLYFIRIVEDVTARKLAEANLERLARARAVAAECGRALVHAGAESAMLQEMCRTMVGAGGYKMAWIGLATGEAVRPVQPAAHAGFEGDEPMTASAAWDANGRYRGFMSEVIRTGRPHIARDILRDPAFARRRERALQHGFQSSIALPLASEGRILGAIAIYAREPDAFDADEIALLTEVADDIAFGLTALRARAERERSETRMREVERRALETFDQAAVGITRTDLNGVTVEANQKFCDMLGYSREEILGRHIKDFTHPDDYGYGALYRSRLAQGNAARPMSSEKRFLRKDGTVLWARRTLSAARDEAGEARYVVAVIEDITGRKEAEERYRSTFENAPIGIMYTSIADDRLLQVNPRLCDMLGYTRDELLGLSTDALIPEQLRGMERAQYRDRMLSGELMTFSSERQLLRRDGSAIWVNRTVSLARDSSGNPLYFIRVIEDITARKELERRFRDTFEQAAVGIFHADLDGRYLRVNRKFCEITGYTNEEMTGPNRPNLSHPEDFDSGATDRKRLLSGEIASHSNEKRYIRKDGTEIWVNRTESLARDETGKPLYLIRVIEDITSRKRVEEAIARERALLRTVVDAVPDRIYAKDLNGRFVLQNEVNARSHGANRSEDLLGKTVHDIFPHAVAERMEAEDRAILESGVPLLERERTTVDAAGDTRWIAATKVPLRDAEGRVFGLVGMNRDITDRKVSALRREMEHEVTKVISEATSVDEAMPKLLRVIGLAMQCAYGARWSLDSGGASLFRADCWADFEPAFEPADESHWLRKGPGGSRRLVVRALSVREPAWIADVDRCPDFGRLPSARKFGLRSAFAFPIYSGLEVLGVMEFFARDAREPDEMLLQVARSIGSQIGQFIQRKEAEQALRASEERYRDVFEASPLPMWVSDHKTLDIIAVNQAAIEHYGYSEEEFLRMNVHDVWAPEEAERYRQNAARRERTQALKLERRHRTKDGRVIDTEVTARLFNLGGRTVWLTVANDVSVRLRAEAALRESEEQFRQLAGNIPQAFWITDTALRETLYVSPAAEAMIGRSMGDILADRRALIRAVHREDRARVHAARKAAVEGGYDETYRIVRPDGSIRWVHDRAFPVRDFEGRICRIAGIAEDVTDRKLAEERLEHLAHYDALTNLPNRALFYDRLKQALLQARRNRWTAGVMFIDADRFKNVNDTLGHAVGDNLLQQIAERLIGSVRAGDTVGRLGGDEFAIALSALSSAQDASLVAQKIMAAFDEPFRLGGTEVYITVSIGITLYPDDSADQDALIKNADAAMYRAKELGRNGYQFYTPEMNARALELLGMENSLRRALERNEFLLHYQPKAGLADGKITGLEALLRWRHPQRGLVAPGEFIPFLEDSGLIVPVGEWVLKSVCVQIKAWERTGIRPVPVAVNLSARQFATKNLGANIKRILDEHEVNPALIELEITESSLMANTEEGVRTLEYLDELGVGLSIDDFGTGYSSLSYLKRFPLDSLKIDRSFVRDVTTDGDDATITRAVISMAHSLGLKVIAEGAETAPQLIFLAEHGCDEVQGYYFSRPLEAEDCGAWLRDGRRLSVPPRATGEAPLVLLVDDDEAAAGLIENMLAKDGYRILCARNIREALAMIGANQVDIVVADQNMPDVPGEEFLRRMKILSPGTVRILCSGYTNFEAIAAAVNSGEIFRFLAKDASEEHVRSVMRQALQARAREILALPEVPAKRLS